MSEEIMNTQQPTNSTPEENGGQGEKMFTQEEVNKIVSDRLARERAKQEQQPDPVAESLAQRERDIAAREGKLTCIEYIREQKLNEGLLEVFDTSDPERFKASVEKLLAAYPELNPQTPPKARFTAPTEGYSDTPIDPIAEAFRRK